MPQGGHPPHHSIMLAALIAAAAEASAQTRNSQDTSANAVFLGCKAFTEGRGTTQEQYMLGNYCSGVVFGLSYIGNVMPPEWRYCAPAGSSGQQLARVVVNYIEARPERMHEDFRLLTLEAFHYAWPC
jgi:hypothetical protein